VRCAAMAAATSGMAPGAASVPRRAAPRRAASAARQRPRARPVVVRSAARGVGSGGGKRISQQDFTEKAWGAVVGAPEVARQRRHQIVETEHLTQVLLDDGEGLLPRLLQKAGADPQGASQYTESFMSRQPRVEGDPEQMLGRNMEALVGRARDAQTAMGDKFCSVEHFALALLDDQRFGKGLFQYLGLDRPSLEMAIEAMRGGRGVEDQNPEGKYEALERYARDLTSAAEEGKLDPVIGRDDEIRRCVQVLSRRTKNNPVLIGEPGVGKTAVAEGLAQRIVAGDVPEALQGRRIMSLDMGALIAGAKFRGEFEDRLKSVLQEVQGAAGGIVLFIDEIHTVVGAGASEGSLDASNLLKPMLGRGELRCIGATTLEEHRKYIEKDPALERRFQTVLVDQPTVESTISILRGLRERYEVHHGVRISDAALVEAATLADRYISERFLPDKAIDVVDEAAAKLKMELTSKPRALDDLDRRLVQMEMERLSLRNETGAASKARLARLDSDMASMKAEQSVMSAEWEEARGAVARVSEIKEEIDKTNVAIAQAEREYDLSKAAELKYGQLISLQNKLEVAEEAAAASGSGGGLSVADEVTEADIGEVICRWTGIPVSKLMQSERDKLLKLEEELGARVLGQSAAVTAVAEAVQRSRAGLADPNKPLASFLFMGPTGVGKTELCKALASFLFDSEDAMVRIDMSEYMEKFAVSRLLGAPPGYVGYEEGGQLTEAVRRRPYTVVLLDEMEKAHADVFNVLLQVLDDGRVTDSQGRTVSFANCVIIMTSNLGSAEILETIERGPDGADRRARHEMLRSRVMGVAQGFFRPEFINRVDEFIVFEPLQREQMRGIVQLQARRVGERLASKKMSLHVTDAALDHLSQVGYDVRYGARPVKRVIQQKLETPLAQALLRGEFAEGDGVLVDVVDDHQPEGYESDGLTVDYTPRRLTFTCLPGEAAREAGLSNTEEETEPVSVSEPW